MAWATKAAMALAGAAITAAAAPALAQPAPVHALAHVSALAQPGGCPGCHFG
jgi:hypothetical protein